MNRIKELVKLCNSTERFKISMMLNNAADYVRSIIAIERYVRKIESELSAHL